MSEEMPSYESLKSRLDEIVEAVSDESLPLDDALDLYEEAVGLGLQASRLMESDIAVNDASDQGAEPDQHEPSETSAPSEQGEAPAPSENSEDTANLQ